MFFSIKNARLWFCIDKIDSEERGRKKRKIVVQVKCYGKTGKYLNDKKSEPTKEQGHKEQGCCVKYKTRQIREYDYIGIVV